MRFLANQAKTRRLIDAAGGDQHVVGPQRDFAITDPAGRAETFADKSASNAEPSSLRLDIQQTQFGDFFAILDEQHRAGDLAVALGDPAALAPSIEILDEGGGDARDQCLEAHVKAIFRGVEHAVAMNDPTHIARLVRPKNIVRLARIGRASKYVFGRFERRDKPSLVLFAQPLQHGRNLIVRAGVDRRERLVTAIRQNQDELPPVLLRRALFDQAALLEGTENSAEIPRIQAELGRDCRSQCRLPPCKLVKNPSLGQRQWTSEQSLVQDTDVAGIEPIEAADGVDALAWHRIGHHEQPRGTLLVTV